MRTRLHYDEELDALGQDVLGCLDLAIEQCERLAGLLAGESAPADVIAGGEDLAQRAPVLLQELLAVIGRQAPVASDLRLVVGLLHTTRHAQRAGEQCAEAARLAAAWPPGFPADLRTSLHRMARTAGTQLAEARQAVAHRDGERARRLVERDRGLSHLNQRGFREALWLAEDAGSRQGADSAVLVARAIDRIADNAIDIAEQAQFIALGTLHPAPGAGTSAFG